MYITTKRLNYIKNLAQACLDEFGTRNPFIISNFLRINYSFIDSQYIDAFLIKNPNGIDTIYISNYLGNYYQKILCAHELGHVLLHKKHELHLFGENKNDKLEYEANLFAINLMPQIQPRDRNYLEYTPDELQQYLEDKIHPNR